MIERCVYSFKCVSSASSKTYGLTMPIPQLVAQPPFNIVRASHAVLVVRDLAARFAAVVDRAVLPPRKPEVDP